MSSLTPNLNLVLPDGGEHVSRQVLNDNSTIIDTAVGSNSQAISKLSSYESPKLLYADQGANLNNVHGTGSSGLYYVGAGVPNSPADYSTLFVISRDGDSGLCSQLVVGDKSYHRIFIGSPPAWSEWKKLATTSDFDVATASLTSVPSGVSLRNVSIKKSGRVITGYIEVSAPSTGGSVGKVSSSSFYPTAKVFFPIWSTSPKAYVGYIDIATDGTVTIHPTDGLSGTIYYSCAVSYIV